MPEAGGRVRGFTLIEVLVVIVVIGILVVIAFPSFVSFLVRTDRGDAREALAQVQLAQERFRSRAGSYTNDFGALGLGAAGATEINSPRDLYVIRIAANDRDSFTATAQAQGRQLRDVAACRGATADTRIRIVVTPGGEQRLPETCW